MASEVFVSMRSMALSAESRLDSPAGSSARRRQAAWQDGKAKLIVPVAASDDPARQLRTSNIGRKVLQGGDFLAIPAKPIRRRPAADRGAEADAARVDGARRSPAASAFAAQGSELGLTEVGSRRHSSPSTSWRASFSDHQSLSRTAP